MSVKIIGASTVKRKFEKYKKNLLKEADATLRQEGRALAVALGEATMPGPGFNEGQAEKFRNSVERDVRRVYASRANPNSVFALMKIHAPHLAGAYWSAHKRGKKRAAADVVRRANLPQGLDPGALKKARRGKQGKVLKRQEPVSLAAEPQLRALAKKQRLLVGTAKAGFYLAAKGIGGRVRRNVVGPGGKRATEEIFPAYVRTLARKMKGLGGAKTGGGEASPRVEIWSSVKHAKEALPGPLYQAAVARASARVRKSLEHAAAELNRKRGGGE